MHRRTLLAAGLAAALPAPGPAGAQPRPETLLVMEKTDHRLAFLDPSDGRRMAELDLPEFPHEFVVDAAGRHAFIGHYGLESSAASGEGGHSVIVADLAARRILRGIDLSPFNRLHGMAIDAADRLCVLSEEKSVLLSLDHPAEDSAAGYAVPTGGIRTHMLALSRDGERAYVTGLLSNTVSLVCPRDAAAAPVLVTTGRMPEGCCLSPEERTLYVGNRRSGTLAAVDTGTMRVRDTRAVGGDPLRVYSVRDGRLLLADLQRESLSISRGDMSEIALVPLGARPSASSLHPSRPLAYVSLTSDEVAVVDLERARVEGRMRTGRGADVTRLLPAG
ncbi:YncE family protein [Roseomonas sp. GCM10028921]